MNEREVIVDLLRECKKLIPISENLLTWCIEPDKKFIYAGHIKQVKRVIEKIEKKIK